MRQAAAAGLTWQLPKSEVCMLVRMLLYLIAVLCIFVM
jgi:hypothetical protein